MPLAWFGWSDPGALAPGVELATIGILAIDGSVLYYSSMPLIDKLFGSLPMPSAAPGVADPPLLPNS